MRFDRGAGTWGEESNLSFIQRRRNLFPDRLSKQVGLQGLFAVHGDQGHHAEF